MRPLMDAAMRQPPELKLPIRWYKRLWVRLPVSCFCAYAVWCGGLYLLQDRMLFRTDLVQAAEQTPASWSPRAERFVLELDSGGQVEGWFLPAPQASRERPAPVVVFCHGNAERIEQAAWFVRKYHDLGCSVLLPEYRGYGRAGGKPSEESIVNDAVCFYSEMIVRADVDPARIVFHGRSLGGGVAAQLAARRKPAALILESSFTSLAVFAHRYAAPMLLAKNPFRTDLVLPKLDVPVLIAHGTKDSVIPIEHGHRLRELAMHPTYIEYECGHNDLPPPGHDAEHWQRIETFLRDSGVLDQSRDH